MDLVDRFIHKYGRLPTEKDPDYLEMLRMTKYRIVPVPDFKPGKCANCGASKNDGRNYIDFGCEVDWFGTVYLCGECLRDIANAMGLFNKTAEQVLELTKEVERLEQQLEQGVQLPEKLQVAIEEFNELYASLHPARNNPTPDPVVSVEPDSSNETESDRSGSIKAKSRTSKSIDVSGSKDVRSLADLLNDAGK